MCLQHTQKADRGCPRAAHRLVSQICLHFPACRGDPPGSTAAVGASCFSPLRPHFYCVCRTPTTQVPSEILKNPRHPHLTHVSQFLFSIRTPRACRWITFNCLARRFSHIHLGITIVLTCFNNDWGGGDSQLRVKGRYTRCFPG